MTITHRMSQSREWQCWAHMRSRCGNSKHPAYRNYGGRGITVCERWRSSFENFYADMGPRPGKMDLDRIDNNGNYEPGNCRWATRGDNVRNSRLARMVEAFGRRLCLSEWSRETGLSVALLCYRLKHGWSIEEALSLPAMRHGVPPTARIEPATSNASTRKP